MDGTYFPYASSTGHEFGERRQKRHCEKCNKEQDKKVR